MQIKNDFQARYAAAILSKRHATGKLEKLIPVFLRSGLDVYPHQIEAAACALYNPYSKGYILADEVGLGKAVEAGLIIAQSYYDGADNIIVVVPKQQAEQWRLLIDRFGLPVKDIDAAADNEDEEKATKQGAESRGQAELAHDRGDDGLHECIRLATYEDAVAQAERIKETPWDLVIIDEAHRLRKFRQAESKTAEALSAAFKDCKKILLTATPIIGSVMDLWGLITFIDKDAFGDAQDFYKRYHKKPDNYPELRELLQPFIFRTLRRQVKADVCLPDRLIHTEQYKLSGAELELYHGIEKYLNKPKKIAFPEMDAYELNLMIYKLFSSSIYALQKTLAGILARLNRIDGDEARTEAAEIQSLLMRATNIPATSKGGAFLRVLHQTLQSLKEKGLPQKAVVFTENTETKDYILGILENTQYNAVEFKSADDIEKFKAKKYHVLVATDVASEGFNIEFASAVFNFDLPWGLQKVEQRIGRIHRIGQKNDVLVFNFLNDQNFADVRIYELSYRRTVTTADILGVSDNFVSITNSGNQAVADMVSTSRSAAEVESDFADLQERFAEFVDENKRGASDTLFNTFDERVAEKTKNYAAYIQAKVAETKALLWDFCKYAIKPYGAVYEDEKSIRIHRSLFRSGNVLNASMYLDRPDMDRGSMITLSNNNIKQLISIHTPFTPIHGSVTATDGKNKGERGLIALYNAQFIGDAGMASENIFVGQTPDGRTLTEDECRQIIESMTEAHKRDTERENEQADALFAKVLPEVEARAAAELTKGVAAEIKQIKRRTATALLRLENEIKAAESEITKLKSAGGADRSNYAFGNNQRAFEAANRLNLLKQNEFIEKTKLKKRETDEITALTAKAKPLSYKCCYFTIEYTTR